MQKVDTQIALTLADDGWLWCDFLFCWYVVFVAKTNSHAREGVRSFKWLLSWIVKYSIIFSEKKRTDTKNESPHSPVYSSSLQDPILTRIQLFWEYALPCLGPYTAHSKIAYITEQPSYIKLMHRLKWKSMSPFYTKTYESVFKDLN